MSFFDRIGTTFVIYGTLEPAFSSPSKVIRVVIPSISRNRSGVGWGSLLRFQGKNRDADTASASARDSVTHKSCGTISEKIIPSRGHSTPQGFLPDVPIYLLTHCFKQISLNFEFFLEITAGAFSGTGSYAVGLVI